MLLWGRFLKNGLSNIVTATDKKYRLYILETEGNGEDHMNVGTPDLNTHNRSNLSAHVNNAPWWDTISKRGSYTFLEQRMLGLLMSFLKDEIVLLKSRHKCVQDTPVQRQAPSNSLSRTHTWITTAEWNWRSLKTTDSNSFTSAIQYQNIRFINYHHTPND